MIHLLLSMLSSTLILLTFKWIEKLKLELFPPIVINYLAASILGYAISTTTPAALFESGAAWLPYSMVIGVMLIVNFYLIGSSTQKAGIAVTTVAAKMSFVLPVIFSLVFDANDIFNLPKGIQVLLAVLAVLLVVYPSKSSTKTKMVIALPIVIFFGLGALDTIIKYCQYNFIKDAEASSIFSAINFSVAAIVGLSILAFKPNYLRSFLNPKVWLVGSLLGFANYGSMYFLINALNSLKFDNSLVFGVNNIGIVSMSVLIAVIAYREKLTKVNWIGLALSVLVLASMIYYLS